MSEAEEKNICWTRVVVAAASSPNFSLFLSSLARRLHVMMKREIPNKSDLHSATVMICVDCPHSARCRKISFSRDRARVRIERSSSSPSGRRSPEIRFAGTSSSSSSVGSTRGPGGASYLPRGAHTAPQGNWCSTSTIWESNYQALPTTPRRMGFCADIRWFRLHLLLMGLGVVLTPGHH